MLRTNFHEGNYRGPAPRPAQPRPAPGREGPPRERLRKGCGGFSPPRKQEAGGFTGRMLTLP